MSRASSAESPPAGPEADEPAALERTIDDEFIEELIEDARLYARYGRYAGAFRDARLFEAIATALREHPASDRLVVELQRVLNETAQNIPYATVAALKSGWVPGRPKPRTILATVLLVFMSILLMFVVGRLTLVHNRGANLAVTVEALIQDQPRATIDRLLREHLLIRLQAEQNTGDDIGAELVSSQIGIAALDDNEREIRRLSNRINVLTAEIGDYLSETSIFPLVGMRGAFCVANWLVGSDQPMFRAYCPDLAGIPTAPPSTTQLTASCEAPDLPAARPEDATVLETWRTLVSAERTWLTCTGVLAFNPRALSILDQQLDQLRQRVGIYALWILPALYGAMGAVMYHMRWVLDPLLPHPSPLRLLHRVVLGALSGVVLGWFYAPGTAIGEAATEVGFSLFVVAFLFGFSLDIFFALLDRLVTFSERSVRGALQERPEGERRLFGEFRSSKGEGRESAAGSLQGGRFRPGPGTDNRPKPVDDS